MGLKRAAEGAVARYDARVTGRMPGVSDRHGGALRVPELITVYFWIVKGLSTAMGEATSDYLVHQLHPVPAVGWGSSVLWGRWRSNSRCGATWRGPTGSRW